ncbi:hypothetical protein PAHAL_6G034900 [Panicum hallii]|jgi:hypothetical protein|uniref:Uncharacterized protein n=1 Tax=Panicum hallii TaxID=206008 RepID=A0A2T8IF16_9POAL|nr:hypothetical protein PAHAL_6G034900 [Panicum hallii]
MCKSESGSNQLELLPARETTPLPTTSKPREKKTRGKAAGKKNKKEVSLPHDNPAMSTRRKIPQQDSCASHTKSKRKLSLADLN